MRGEASESALCQACIKFLSSDYATLLLSQFIIPAMKAPRSASGFPSAPTWTTVLHNWISVASNSGLTRPSAETLMLKSNAWAICFAGALIKNDTVLLVLRTHSARFWPDSWGLFGGHVNKGESLEEAIQREAREELGI